MELQSKYDPQQVESKWYQYWLAVDSVASNDIVRRDGFLDNQAQRLERKRVVDP